MLVRFVLVNPTAILRLEGIGVFLLALLVYWQLSFSWTLFWLTILLPDLSFLGYMANARVGAATYNIAHTKVLPCALAVVAFATDSALLHALSLIWFVHIGIDRALGYGLKNPNSFKSTHLGILGR